MSPGISSPSLFFLACNLFMSNALIRWSLPDGPMGVCFFFWSRCRYVVKCATGLPLWSSYTFCQLSRSWEKPCGGFFFSLNFFFSLMRTFFSAQIKLPQAHLLHCCRLRLWVCCGLFLVSPVTTPLPHTYTQLTLNAIWLSGVLIDDSWDEGDADQSFLKQCSNISLQAIPCFISFVKTNCTDVSNSNCC